MSCNKPSQQQLSFNTIYTVETTATATYDSYVSLVAQGKLPTNDVPRISKLFNKFQAYEQVALDLVHNNTNAIAPADLMTQGQTLVNEILVIKQNNPIK
jgi:hypothetical protein